MLELHDMATHEIRLRVIFKDDADLNPDTVVTRIREALGDVEIVLDNHLRAVTAEELSDQEMAAILNQPTDHLSD